MLHFIITNTQFINILFNPTRTFLSISHTCLMKIKFWKSGKPLPRNLSHIFYDVGLYLLKKPCISTTSSGLCIMVLCCHDNDGTQTLRSAYGDISARLIWTGCSQNDYRAINMQCGPRVGALALWPSRVLIVAIVSSLITASSSSTFYLVKTTFRFKICILTLHLAKISYSLCWMVILIVLFLLYYTETKHIMY